MSTTSTTPVAPEIPRHSMRPVRCVALAAATIVAVAVASASMSDARTMAPQGGCTLTPSAADIAVAQLTAHVGTWRTVDGVVEVMHTVSCTNGRRGWVWIAADII